MHDWVIHEEKIKSIDFLKGIAILMVILVHTSQSFDLPIVLQQVLSIGQMGCQLFFIISGFSISLSILTKRANTIEFYKRRLCSLAPGWYVAIVLYIILNTLRFIRGGGICPSRKLWYCGYYRKCSFFTGIVSEIQ